MATGTLTGQTIANTYKSLLKVTGTTAGGETLHATTLKVIEDGDGNPSPIQLAQNRLEIVPTSDHANAFEVSQADGTQIFNINSSSPLINLSANTKLITSGAASLLVGSTGAAGVSISLDGDSNGDGAGADYSYISHDTDGVLNIVQDSPSGTNEIRFGTAGGEDKITINSSGSLIVGSDGSGADVTFYSDTAGDSFVWDSSAEKLTITGTNGQTALDVADGNLVVADNVDIEGDIDVNGTANLDEVDIDGKVNMGNNYIVNEKGRTHSAPNKMSSPYMEFDGTNDYVEIADNNKLHFEYAMSVSMWFRCKYPTIGSGQVLFSKYNGTGNKREFVAYLATDESIRFGISSDGTDDTIERYTNPISNLTEWNHAVIVWDSDGATGTIKIYINGVEQTLNGSGTIHTVMANLTEPLRIGSASAGGDYFNGDMAEVAFYNCALHEEDVKAIYSGAPVTFQHEGADNTNIITGDNNDMDTVGSWYVYVNGTHSVVGDWAGNSGSGIFKYVWSTGANGAARLDSQTTAKKRYRVNWKAKALSGATAWAIGSGRSAELTSTGYNNTMAAWTLTGTETVRSGEFTADGGNLYISQNPSSSSSASTILFDDFEVIPAGLIVHLDGTGMASDKWFDKSGNDLHGTTSGVTVRNAPSAEDDGLTNEVGTWTPSWTQGFSGTNYNLQHGKYVRTGSVIHVFGCIGLTASGTTATSDPLRMELPYAAANGQNNFVGTAVVQTGAALDTESAYIRVGTASGSDATAYFVGQADAADGQQSINGDDIGTSGLINFQITYQADY